MSIEARNEKEPDLRFVLGFFITVTLFSNAHAQSPLNPPGWSNLYTQSRSVGYWINGARLCGIDYDQAALEAQIQQLAIVFNLSAGSLKSEGQKRADEAVPHFTDQSCKSAREQAKRLGILSGYKPPRPTMPSPDSLSE